MSIESDTITGTEYSDRMKECGVEPVSNPWIAGRMPPGQCFGLHPAPSEDGPGYHDAFNNGDLMAALQEQLGEPMANPKLAFEKVASPEAPSFSNTLEFDPRLLS